MANANGSNYTGALNAALEDIPSRAYIKDSGKRQEFPTGAVRDIQEGKGRCDLIPLDALAHVLNVQGMEDRADFLNHLEAFKCTGMACHITSAINSYLKSRRISLEDTCNMLLEVAKHFEEGAKKYGENNWQKGIPVDRYMDSAIRHFLKCYAGHEDEPHDRAFLWNILCMLWTAMNKPELNVYITKMQKGD